jgi:hypothetical protein
MTPPLPAYAAETLSRLSIPELIRLMVRDEDRVPRSVIDECASRGEEMVQALGELVADERFWEEAPALGMWWLRLHAAMILGLIASERAGLLLVSLMRLVERAQDENLEDWLSGHWPALFRNKPEAVVPSLRELAQDRDFDWFARTEALESAVAFGERDGAAALDAALDWAAAIAADEAQHRTLRLMVGVTLLDFPRERHRALLEDLVAQQTKADLSFSAEEVRQAFSRMRDTPHWERFEDPWKFYAPEVIARRQERWAREDAESADEESAFDDAPEPQTRLVPKIGRNDPCPCGSGKKYKRCCLARTEAEPVEDLAWRRLRRLLDEHQRDMLRFITNVYGRVALDEA